MRDRDPIDALVVSVSDGLPVDWNGNEAIPGGSQRAFRALRDVARIAEFSRELQRSPDAAGAPGHASALERWGELTILEPVGSGASGQVWRAWDPTLRREVALKFLRTPAAASTVSTGVAANAAPPADSRLLDEARALARVRHPGVVAVYGIAEHDGRAGMWMEHLRGGTLADEIERSGSLPSPEVARIGLALCRALEAVHVAGLVHRDIKPANVVLEPDGRVVLTDFGLGLRRGLDDMDARRVSGTPIFMSPELLAGEPATARSDVYALGATLRWALTGRPPFRAKDIEELKVEANAGPATSLAAERPDAPAGLIAAIDRAMTPAVDARFATAAKMALALETASDEIAHSDRSTPPTRRSRARGIVIAAALALMLAASAWVVSQRSGVPASDPRETSPTSLAVKPDAPAATTPASSIPSSYDVQATLVDRTDGGYRRLAPGDRVAPGNRLSLEFRGSRRMWVYVLNQDDRGETYLLFPQPLFDLSNPLPPGATSTLPGPIGGQENGWTVTSRGGHEHFLVVASPEPVPEIESELAHLPAARPDRPIQYAAIPPATVQRLRGVGGVAPLPADASRGDAGTFERFEALSGRETVSDGIWVRRITLENPLR